MTLQFEMYTRLFHLGYAKGATSKTNSHGKKSQLFTIGHRLESTGRCFLQGHRKSGEAKQEGVFSLFCLSTRCWRVARDKNCAEHGFCRFEWLGPSECSHGLIYWLGLGHRGHMLRIRNFEKPVF